MSSSEKMMEMVTIVSSLFLERLLMKRFLLDMTKVLAMAITIGVFCSAILIAGLFYIYNILLAIQVTTTMAVIVTVSMAFLIVVMLGIAAVYYIRKLHQALNNPGTTTPKTGHLIEAFLKGMVSPNS